MRIGFKTVPVDVTWDTLLSIWELGDQIGMFDSGWLNDHFLARKGRGGQHEAMTAGAALAARTRHLTIGHAVLGNGYRHPILLAKMATAMDHIAEGRFVLGLGAGAANPEESETYGLPAASIGDRIARLSDTVHILKGLWAHPDGFDFESASYRLHDARCEPAPRTPGGPPIWLGVRGRTRSLRILAALGDGWAATSDGWRPDDEGNLAEFRELLGVLRRHCDELRRDPSSIEVSARILTRGRSAADLIAEGSALLRSGADHLIFSVPARLGPAELERVAVDVARPLRESFASSPPGSPAPS